MQEITTTINSDIKSKIYSIRDKQVMLDKDLAELYGVETKHINQAVKNNIHKFPNDFYFELTDEEDDSLRSKNLTLKNPSRGGHRKYNTKVFTEQGVYMLATILKSKFASDITISIIRTFAQMRQFISQNTSVFQRLETLEQSQLITNTNVNKIFKALESSDTTQSQGIFFNEQIFDAHNFVSNLIRGAKSSIVLIDNYVDDSTLLLFSKNQNIEVTIHTNTFTKALKLDLEKYNKQYKDISIKTNKKFHDRFLIIDNKEVYHIGASLKDLGKKTFAFSKMEDLARHLLDNI
ncbi:MAG: ORF6N domain-containing protein [Sulfurimonas sp.]|nr:ORF6N domain-containing protein [Sulfurimonas sp.]